jgi:hypothetical protein
MQKEPQLGILGTTIKSLGSISVMMFKMHVTPPADTARLPPNAFGTYADGDVGAINQAAWAFADPSRTRNNPGDAARAAAAVDYLAGELNTSPRWDFMSVLTKMEILQARAEVRHALGIAPGSPHRKW